LKRHLKNPENRKNKVAGINETLPFANNSFDYVLSDYSSFHHLDMNYPKIAVGKAMAKKMLEEVIRVLRPDGEARIAGAIKVRSGNGRAFYEAILKEISQESESEISWNFILKPGIPEYLILNKY